MPLESASNISQLNAANPASTDLLGQGDDHIRLIKATLLATFPNINAPMTLSDEVLNALPTLAASGSPVGLIAAWFGLAATVPAGWAICNGQTVARSDASGNITTPDLRDRVVIGSGPLSGELATYGAPTASGTTTDSGAHSHAMSGTGEHAHTVAVTGHALTVDEIPSHSHSIGISSLVNIQHDASDDGDRTVQAGGSSTAGIVAATGGGVAHTHGATITGAGAHSHVIDAALAHNHSVTVGTFQPALSLHFIMKV